MSEYTIKAARLCEANGKFLEAIDIYAELSRVMNTKAFEFDIKRLKGKVAKNESRSLSAFLKDLNVDQIYVLNLSSDTGKRLRAARELTRVGLSFRFFNGVNGKYSKEANILFQEYLQRAPGARKSSSHISESIQLILRKNSSLGTFGYLLSQREIFKDALNKGYRRICVFDDDVIFTDFSYDHLNRLKQKLVNFPSWKVCHLGASEYSEIHPADIISEDVGCYIAVPHKTCGSFAAIYDGSIFEELLSVVSEMDGAFDNVALGSLYEKYSKECFVSYPNICLADVHSSDIRTGRDQFVHSKKMRWDISSSLYSEYRRPHVVNVVVKNSKSAKYILSAISDNLDLHVRVFYIGEDGIRPVHTIASISDEKDSGQKFDEIYNRLVFDEGSDLGFQLPMADADIFWPCDVKISFETIKEIVVHKLCPFEVVADGLNVPYKVLNGNAIGRKGVKGLASVIMPVYRDFELVKPSIESVLHQDYKKLELILVFDNPEQKISVADVFSYVEGAAKAIRGDAEIQIKVLMHRKTRYGCGARNTGLFQSEGEYISFLDDDDVYLPSRISQNITVLDEDRAQEYDACYCAYMGLWGDDKEVDASRMKSGNFLNDVICLNYLSHYIHTGTVTYRRLAIMDICGFDEKYIRHQDIEMNGRFFRKYKMTFSPFMGMKFKPQKKKTKATFKNSLGLLLDIKKKLAEDFSDIVKEYDESSLETFLVNHASDLRGYFSENPSSDEDIKKIVLNFLK